MQAIFYGCIFHLNNVRNVQIPVYTHDLDDEQKEEGVEITSSTFFTYVNII